MKKAFELIPGDWIMHRGHKWRIKEIRNESAGEWNMAISMYRDDLDGKKILKRRGEWYPGRTTVSSFLRVNRNEEFDLCEADPKQFSWMNKT